MITVILPMVNASLNVFVSIFLVLGYFAILSKDQILHRKYMLIALLGSIFFLVGYISLHYLKGGIVTRYEKEGIIRTIYFIILGTHTPLAAIVPFAALTAVFHALKGNIQKHTRITKWLYPVWLYVSVTGVIIYFMLYIF